MSETKWFWMMDYCKKRKIPPAQSWAWNQAEKAYEAILAAKLDMGKEGE